ncbi:MAG: VOC family protein [Planctomycetaceae bacterium]
MRFILPGLVTLFLATFVPQVPQSRSSDGQDSSKASHMQFGSFSVSLVVKDVNVSKAFYEKLGFKQSGGDVKRKYVVMQNATSTIGLYQGMFEKNMLTYNPGWDRDCKTLPEFMDVREIQQQLKNQGIELDVAADETTTGPAFLTITDPDGNPILIDQHVDRPKSHD